jgi:hypothetical protein
LTAYGRLDLWHDLGGHEVEVVEVALVEDL